jgi:hypothetical protein
MQQLVIHIEDSKVDFLKGLLKELNISIGSNEPVNTFEKSIPECQQKLVLERKLNAKPEDYISEKEMLHFLDSE